MNFSKRKSRLLCLSVCIALSILIVLSCATLVLNNNKVAESNVINNADTISKDLLLDISTRATDGVGNTFNGNALKELYERLTGQKNASFSDVETKARDTSTKNYSDTDVKTMHSGMDSGEIRTANGGQNIVVTLDGKEWIVTALTSGGTSANNDVILTLLLKDVAYNSRFGTWSSANFTATYPDNMYSTSYVRAGLLNNGSEYSTSATAKKVFSDTGIYGADGYPFGIYTDSTATGSITNFLVKPNEVLYQQNESLYDVNRGINNSWLNAPNEASKNKGTTSSKWNSSVIKIQDNSKYFDWGDDLLWLPSLAETGQSKRNTVVAGGGLWNLDAQQRSFSSGSIAWLRSGHSNDHYIYAMESWGIARTFQVNESKGTATGSPDNLSNGNLAVRPALNLNLTMADKCSFTLLDVPTDESMTYTSEKIGVHSLDTLPNWYISSVFDSSDMMTTVYKDKITGVAISGGLPKDEGEYTVEFTLTATSKAKYAWSDSDTNTSDMRSMTFKITPKSIKYTLSGGGSFLPKVEHDPSDLGVNDTKFPQGSILGFRYTGLYGSSYDDTKLPTVNGMYRATVISLNHNYTPDLSISPNYKDFTVDGARANVPTFNDNAQGYDGGNDVSFVLNGFDPAQMEVVMPLPSGVNYNGGDVITANRAGKYKIKIALKNKDGSIYWNSLEGSEDMADKELEFEITPAQISVMIDPDSGSNDTIKVVRGEKTKVSGMILQQPLMGLNSDTTTLHFWADYGSSKYELGYTDTAGNKVMTGYPIDKNSGTVTLSDLELHTDVLPMNGKWTLRIESSNGDYVAVLDSDIYLQVEAKVVMADPTWILKRNSARIDTQSVVLGDTTPIVYSKTLAYNDRNTYEFQMLAPGYTVSDYQVVANNGASNTAIGKNADTYTTSVKLTDKNNNEVIYSITWTIDPVKFDLSQVKWLNNGQLPYDKVNGSKAELDPKTLPAGLIPTVINNTGTTVGTSGSASVTFALDSAYVGNYIVPDENDNTSYIDPNSNFEWSKTWTIVPAQIQSSSWKNESYTDTNGKAFDIPVLRDPNADGGIVEYEYYECDSTGNIINNTPIAVKDIIWSESDAKYYIAKPILQDTNNYTLDDPSAQSKVFRVGKDLTKVSVSLESASMEYNTNPRHAKVSVANGALPTTAFDLTYYDGYTRLATAPTEVGKYRVEVSLKLSYIDKYQIEGDYEFDYEITKAQIAEDWNDNIKPPTLKLKYGQINGVEYEIVDSEDNVVTYNDLKAGESYKIRAKVKDSQLNNFIFVGDKTETEWHEFSVSANDKLVDPNDPKNPSYPQVDPDLPTNSGDDNNPSGNVPGSGDEGGSGTLDEILAKLKEIPLWQIIASVISIILILIFASKGFGYLSKSKQNKRMAESKYKTYYAGAFLGLATAGWTAIACVLMGLAVLSIVFMIIAKSKYNKSLIYAEELRDEYERNKADIEERRREEEARKRDENMQMMFMSMMGGNAGAGGGMAQGMPQGGYGYAQSGISVEEMRGLISETVTALLPGMQQMLPQQASSNDELVQKLLEKTEKNEETMQKLMMKIAEQPVERVVEKEVAATTVNDETIKQMMKNQEMLMEKILELSAAQPQVVEKVVEVPVEVEKIVEKEVPVEVEKIVEKVVEKEVKVIAPAKPKAEKTPRLTLDEAYALLSKQQKKYFDSLREYALSKDKCKEKKSTYFILLGQSSVNPLVKLTIKKDTTVALFKMEDEYLKDIKRDATGEGTKVKVKETEVIIGDAQACKIAKNMIDLREDQIERYQELLREQRSMKSKK